MGQSVEAYVAYGFGLKSDGVPEEIEEFIDIYGSNCGLSDLLDVGFACWGDDTQPPVIYVKSSQTWAMDGVPTLVDTFKLNDVSSDEVAAISKARADVIELLQADEDYGSKWAPEVGEIGWIVWGNYG